MHGWIYVWICLNIKSSFSQTVPSVKYVSGSTQSELSKSTTEEALTPPLDYECSMRNAISTIVVKENNLIDICTLGEEYQISFKLYIQKFQTKKTILDIFDSKSKKIKKNKILTIKSSGQPNKLRFIGFLGDERF